MFVLGALRSAELASRAPESMFSVDGTLSNNATSIERYFAGQDDARFYRDCRLLLMYTVTENECRMYDLRRPQHVANLNFFEAPDDDIGYEFDIDDRFVLAYRQGINGVTTDVRRIVFGYDGTVRIHKRFVNDEAGGHIIDCPEDEAKELLSSAVRGKVLSADCNLLDSRDPNMYQFAIDIYYRSLIPPSSGL